MIFAKRQRILETFRFNRKNLGRKGIKTSRSVNELT